MRRTLVHPVNPRVKLLLFTEQFSALSKMLRLRGYLSLSLVAGGWHNLAYVQFMACV